MAATAAAAATVAAEAAASRAIKKVFVKRGTCYSHNGHVTTYIYVHMFVTMNRKRIVSSSLIW